MDSLLCTVNTTNITFMHVHTLYAVQIRCISIYIFLYIYTSVCWRGVMCMRLWFYVYYYFIGYVVYRRIEKERASERESNKTWIDCAVYAREWRRLLDCVCQKSTTNFSFVDTIHSAMHGIHSYIFDTKMPQRESYMSCFFSLSLSRKLAMWI